MRLQTQTVKAGMKREGWLRNCGSSILGKAGGILEWVGLGAGDGGKMACGSCLREVLNVHGDPSAFSLNSPRRQWFVCSFRAYLTWFEGPWWWGKASCGHIRRKRNRLAGGVYIWTLALCHQAEAPYRNICVQWPSMGCDHGGPTEWATDISRVAATLSHLRANIRTGKGQGPVVP